MAYLVPEKKPEHLRIEKITADGRSYLSLGSAELACSESLTKLRAVPPTSEPTF